MASARASEGDAAGSLLILAHGGSWDRRFQASSLAASAAASGLEVDLALFFAALESWVGERWDELDPAPPLAAADLDARGAPRLSPLIEGARETGNLRLLACSASMRFLGLPAAEVQARVDLIAGWQTFTRLTLARGRVVTL